MELSYNTAMKKQKIRVRLVIFNDQNDLLLMHDSKSNIYFYPGGKVEFGETVKAAAEREAREECDDEFIFDKILYIRDFFGGDQEQEHSLELFILGKLKNNRIDNSKDPSRRRKFQSLSWFNLDNLPENLYPQNLSKKLADDFKAGFPREGEYVGVIK